MNIIDMNGAKQEKETRNWDMMHVETYVNSHQKE